MGKMEESEMKDLRVITKDDYKRKLFDAVESNNLRLLKKELRGLSTDLNRVSKNRCVRSILEVCCKRADDASFVKEILAVGIDVNYLNKTEKKAPIHLAASNGFKDVVNALLEHPQVDVNILDGEGNSALHLAVAAGKVECTKLLLQSNDVQPNRWNDRGLTPAYMAATSDEKNDELMQTLLSCPEINTDVPVEGKMLGEVIAENYPHLMLFRYLYVNDADAFISHITAKTDLDGNDGKSTYLQYACSNGMKKVVKVLLELGANPNETTRKNNKYPLFLAAYNGFAEIIKIFLDSKNPKVIYQMTDNNAKRLTNEKTHCTSVLHCVIIGSVFSKPFKNVELCDYDKSFELLLPICTKLDINFADSDGNTCLHHAAFANNRNYIFSLMDHGAYIGKKNNFGEPPLSNVGYSTLEAYLDKCVVANNKSINNDKYEIQCSYKFLCPPKVYKHNQHSIIVNEPQLESQNIILENIPETDPLLYINKIPELRPLLFHPVLSLFLHLKWTKINKSYLMNAIFDIVFLASLTAYILCTFELPKVKTGLNIGFYLWITVWALLKMLILREFVQCISFPRMYISSSENWLEISAILLTVSLLFEDLTRDIRIPLAVIAIQVSWGKFIFILGRHPKFAVPSAMFKVVSKNFLKFLLWYSILIIAFILSFYLLFKGDDDEHQGFDDILLAAFNTILMISGELEPSKLQFSSSQVISRLTFVLFIFLVPIVLINLLNGLAVNATRKIQKEAAIIAIVSRAKFINFFETMSIRNKDSKINRNLFGRQMFYLCTRWYGINLMLFPDALYEPNKPIIKIFPNNNNSVEFEASTKSNQIKYVEKCEMFHLDDESVVKAKNIIKSNLENQKKCDEEKVNNVVKVVEEFKNVLSMEKQKKIQQETIDIFVDSVKEFKEILNLEKQKNDDNMKVFDNVFEEFKEMLFLEKRKNEENMNNFVKLVDEFKEVLNVEKRSQYDVETMKFLVESVKELKKLLNTKHRK